MTKPAGSIQQLTHETDTQSEFSLDELVGSVRASANRVEEIDMSDLFNKRVGQAVFTFEEADTPTLYSIPEQVQFVKRQRKKWPELLCQGVALMAMCHRAPKVKTLNTLIMYVQMVDNLGTERFMEFTKRFYDAFPGLADPQKAIEEAKNS